MKPIFIFDFDGTLCDTRDLSQDIYNQIAQKYGYKKVNAKLVSKLVHMSVFEVAKELGVPLFRIPFLLNEGRQLFASHQDNLKWFPGILATLKRLHKNGSKLYIISSNSQNTIKKFFGADKKLFTKILASSLFGKHVIIKRILNEAAKKAKKGEAPPQAWYIGDEIRDVEAGNAAKVNTIAVSWGYNSPKALKKANPTILAKNATDILKALKL